MNENKIYRKIMKKEGRKEVEYKEKENKKNKRAEIRLIKV